MSNVREYIGARYVPVVAGDWDATKQTEYEPITVVLYQGNSYLSKKYVPKGIDILNEDYWVRAADYNAQVDAYRQEVRENTGTTNEYKHKVDTAVKQLTDTVNDYKTDTDADIASYKSETDTKIADYKSAIDASEASYKADTDADILAYKNAVDASEAQYKESTDNAINTFYETAKRDFAGYTPFDAAPTAGSDKGVTSGGVYDALPHNAQYTPNDYTVIIGDSYSASQSESPLWYTYQSILKGSTAYTNAYGGTGFTAGAEDKNFLAQVEAAHTALANKNVVQIYVVGGLNDLGANKNVTNYPDASGFKTAVTNVFKKIREYWPNVQVYCGGIQSFQWFNWYINNDSAPSVNAVNILTNILNFISTAYGAVFIDLRTTFMYTSGIFGDSNSLGQRHPNALGEQILANKMALGDVYTDTVNPLNYQNDNTNSSLVTATDCTLTGPGFGAKNAGSPTYNIAITCIVGKIPKITINHLPYDTYVSQDFTYFIQGYTSTDIYEFVLHGNQLVGKFTPDRPEQIYIPIPVML